ncbi:MAG: histidine kinase, partial [Actinomycetota bacterium]
LQVTSYGVHLGAFAIAAIGDLWIRGADQGTWVGIVIALAGVVFGLSLRVPFPEPRWRSAVTLGASVVCYSTAVALTGGIVSTFAILPVAAIFAAAAGGGFAYALPTATASILGVLSEAWFSGSSNDPAEVVRISAVYAIVALTFSEVRRAITSETKRAQGLIVAAEASRTRMGRLTATHELLEDLVQVAQSPDVNAVSTAQDAIRDVGLILPDTAARIVTTDGTVLARRGETPDHTALRTLPISCSGNDVASLELWDETRHLTADELSGIERAVEPVGLAIDNDALLQSFAGITIQRERVRLARELHDDVAPSIAAVGLSLDMTLMSGDLDDEQTRNLSATRSNVTRLVDQVRERVQDLRADRSMSVVEMAHTLVADVDADGPTVIVNIDERTPPRPAIAIEIEAFMSEAFRNSLNHAQPTAIWITGRITEQEGFLAVQDNGTGFDHDQSHDGRFGLIGMRERAAVISADFELDTAPGQGTVVSMTWRDGS